MEKPPPITAYTLTFNEARQMRAVLESLRWADELIVVDSFSTDGTVEIAREFGAKVISEKFIGFGPLRNLALKAATHDWIFSLDADERCTTGLVSEIHTELQAPRFDAYHVPRKSHFLGYWIRHCGWYPDYRQPQLFNRRKFRYREDIVHEGFQLDGQLGYLQQPVLQYPWDTIEIALAKLQRYSTLMGQRYHADGRSASLFRMLGSPAAMFFRIFIWQRGFLDGRHGLVLAILYSYYTFLKYAKLWELQKTQANTAADPSKKGT